MPFRTLLAFAVLAVSALGCEQNAKLETTSKAFESSADACLLSVRDRHTRFSDTPACTALQALYEQYYAAGGDRENTPARYELTYQKGLRMAWTARAKSEPCSADAKIW